ncbi:MAG TPA: hypothetical protein VLI06_10670 [Solimonas sp.]|nr:hypothetical protein [Solimonas sp.]
MSTFVIILLIFNVALSLILALLFLRLWRVQHSLHGRLRELAPNLSNDPARSFELTSAARPSLISIEILNPMELAAKETWIAGVLGSVTPTLIRRLVYQRAAQMVREELKGHGVTAEVRQHHAP